MDCEFTRLAREELTERSRDEVQELVKEQQSELASLRQECVDSQTEVANLVAELAPNRSKTSKGGQRYVIKMDGVRLLSLAVA